MIKKASFVVILLVILVSVIFIIDIETPTEYKGVHLSFMSFRPDENYGCTQEDVDRLKGWGCNTIQITINWDGFDEPAYQNGIEPAEFLVGNPETGEGYSEQSIDRLHSVVDLVQENDMNMVFVINPISKGTVLDDYRWAQKYGNEFLIFNLQPGTTPMAGLDRYCNFLTYICYQFPDVAIAPWFFPYHMDIDRLSPNIVDGTVTFSQSSLDIQTEFYEMVQPRLINTIRTADEKMKYETRDIFICPLLQGLWWGDDGILRATGGLAEQPYYDDKHIYYGINSHDGDDEWGLIVRRALPWDGDMDEFNDHWKPAVDFKNAHPEAKLICNEWIGLVIQEYEDCPDCNARPIEESRLNWTEAMFVKAEELDMSWLYWGYIHYPLPGGPQIPENPLDDGAETPIVTLIKKYL